MYGRFVDPERVRERLGPLSEPADETVDTAQTLLPPPPRVDGVARVMVTFCLSQSVSVTVSGWCVACEPKHGCWVHPYESVPRSSSVRPDVPPHGPRLWLWTREWGDGGLRRGLGPRRHPPRRIRQGPRYPDGRQDYNSKILELYTLLETNNNILNLFFCVDFRGLCPGPFINRDLGTFDPDLFDPLCFPVLGGRG